MLYENLLRDKKLIRKAVACSNGDARAAVFALESESFDSRDSKENIFKTVQKIFRAETVKTALTAIETSEKAPEEIFRWIHENMA